MDLKSFLMDILAVFLAAAISSVIFSAFGQSVYMRILFAPLQKSIKKVKSKFVYKSGILVLGLVIISILNAIFIYSDRTYLIMMGVFSSLCASVLFAKKKPDIVKEK